ncbi:conjugative transposon TraM protein [Pedobacter sp. UYEF25]
MKIDFKRPEYVIPLLVLPFLCLFFYVYRSSAKTTVVEKNEAEMQNNVAEVSDVVKKSELTNKLDAYRDQYKQADGYSAINSLDEEKSQDARYGNGYSDREKQMLDSIDQAMNGKYNRVSANIGRNKDYLPYSGDSQYKRSADNRLSQEDKALAAALSNLSSGGTQNRNAYSKRKNTDASIEEPDPMETFKKQMSYMDSMGKASDPEYKAEMERQLAMKKADEIRSSQIRLEVTKPDRSAEIFNTLYAHKHKEFIKAIVDENVTGYAGSRIRIRLLEDVKAGNKLIKRGSYLYAEVSGFSDQRVNLTIQSILSDDNILPVKLDIYDLDGLPGLYVPASAFREFSKNLGSNSMQGFNMQNSSQNQQQFMMSALDKVFQSTSTAIASLIRKNKAKIKYNTYIYLIDTEELQNAQKNY